MWKAHLLHVKMTSMVHKKKTAYLSWFKKIYKKANSIIAKKPNLDRDTVVQTLFLLEETPKERLNRALLRGSALRAYKNRNSIS